MRKIYLAASILGAVLPWSIFFTLGLVRGFDIQLMFDNFQDSDLAIAVLADLLISSIVFWFFLYSEGHRMRMANLWVFIVLNLTIGLSLALPLFLYIREGKLEQVTARS